MPTFTLYNMRAAQKKLISLAEDMEERGCQISILTELWECEENFCDKLKEIGEKRTIKYISNPRKTGKKGGGCGFLLMGEDFHLTKLNVQVPKNLETCWGLLKTTKPNSEIKKIIFGVFYYPPKSRMKTPLLNHLNVTINILKLEHPSAQVVILGDRNEIPMRDLGKIHSSLTLFQSQ